MHIPKPAHLGALSFHPLINPRVNPVEILPVNGIPKRVIANDDAVATDFYVPAIRQ